MELFEINFDFQCLINKNLCHFLYYIFLVLACNEQDVGKEEMFGLRILASL